MQTLFRQDERDNTLLGRISWSLPSILMLVIGIPMSGYVIYNLACGLTYLLILIIAYLLDLVGLL